jgi:hypothetical protein
MSDDWEKELEDLQEDTVVAQDSQYKGESEEIIKPKFEPKAPTEPKENPNDYEKLWQEKNKERLEALKEESKAFEGLDEKTRAKKMEEKRIMNDVHEFIEGEKAITKKVEKEVVSGPLVTEKDFVDLAVSSVSRINSAKKPSKFTFTYLKHNLDLLAPTLNNEQLYQLLQDLTVLHNKKTKETSNKPSGGKSNKKPMIKDNKGIAQADTLGKIESKEEFYEDENDYNEDDFM